jgi:hypothetical protein
MPPKDEDLQIALWAVNKVELFARKLADKRCNFAYDVFSVPEGCSDKKARIEFTRVYNNDERMCDTISCWDHDSRIITIYRPDNNKILRHPLQKQSNAV